MRVALVYDRVNKWGGAERVLLALHKIFPNAPLFTAVYHKKRAVWAKVFRVKTSFLQNFPFATHFHELYAPLMPFAFQSFSFKGYDLVISVTSEAAKGIRVPKKTMHICYCLTPTRYLWSGYNEYFKNSFFRIISWPLIIFLRYIDKKASRRLNIFVAISSEVKNRIRKYYDRDATVIYPPVSLAEIKTNSVHLKGYFLVVSRLVPYKRIDIAIKACNKLSYPLVIIGSGIEEKRLKALASRTIFFRSNLTDHELVGYYKNCRALIFPGIEDFGLSIVEAQIFGKPVIAYKGGGALETVVEGKTGLFFAKQTPKSLISVLKRFDEKKFRPLDCIRWAARFSENEFREKFLSAIKIYKNKL